MGQFQGVPGPSQDAFDAQTQAIANLDDRIDTLNSNQAQSPTINTGNVAAGVVKCVIKDGWAYVSGSAFTFKSAGDSKLIITDVPKAKLQANGAFSGANAAKTATIRASGDCCWINENGEAISVHLGSAYGEQHWFSLAYPVA